MGPSNRGRWSNPEFDATLAAALHTLDDAKRNALFGRAAEIAVAEAAVIPVYFTINTWASKKAFTYDARMDELTLATGFRPVN
jgi:peptide/nickel transport system substrate-binding protein